jgi:hypothetical protein
MGRLRPFGLSLAAKVHKSDNPTSFADVASLFVTSFTRHHDAIRADAHGFSNIHALLSGRGRGATA